MHSGRVTVALLFYGYKVLETHDYDKDYANVIQKIRDRRKTTKPDTRTNLALEDVKKMVENNPNFQNNVRQIVFVLTDGRSDESVDNAASDLKSLNIAIYACGVSSKVDKDELEAGILFYRAY